MSTGTSCLGVGSGASVFGACGVGAFGALRLSYISGVGFSYISGWSKGSPDLVSFAILLNSWSRI